MQAIAQLCDRVILMERGGIALDGPSNEVVAQYLQMGHGTSSEQVWPDLAKAPGDSIVRLRRVRVVDESGSRTDAVDVRRPVGIEIELTVLRDAAPIFPKIKLFDGKGDVAFNALDTSARWREPSPPGDYVATAWIPGNLLNEGLLSVHVDICSMGLARLSHHATSRDMISFHVHDPGEGGSARGQFSGQLQGVVRPLLEWT
jgi:lipopolysaccharide transport system ATP-binding protein